MKLFMELSIEIFLELLIELFPERFLSLSFRGTYVKSCRMTRAGLNGTSTVCVCVLFQSRMFSTSEDFTRNWSQFRTAASSRTRMEKGSRSEERSIPG